MCRDVVTFSIDVFYRMEVLLVRHGESENNVVMHQLSSEVREGTVDRSESERLWLERRSPDPALTEKGAAEARRLAPEMARVLAGGGTVFSSPFLRTLQTTEKLLAETPHAQPVVHYRSDICEARGCAAPAAAARMTAAPQVGGVYAGGEEGRRAARPGSCLDGAAIRGRYGFRVDELPGAHSPPGALPGGRHPPACRSTRRLVHGGVGDGRRGAGEGGEGGPVAEGSGHGSGCRCAAAGARVARAFHRPAHQGARGCLGHPPGRPGEERPIWAAPRVSPFECWRDAAHGRADGRHCRALRQQGHSSAPLIEKLMDVSFTE